jgi:uncharacterized integral membrane protein
VKHKLKLSVVFLILVLLVIFTAQNIAIINVKFLMWDVSMSRSIMVIGLLFIGFIIGLIFGLSKHKKTKDPL